MPLLVVPLAGDEVDRLTLGEWDRLRACERVLFEQVDHPLLARLRDEGVAVGPFDVEPDATRDGWALVADPDSARIAELALAGAVVTSGTAAAPDALTAARGAYVGRRAAGSLGTLAIVMARLRGPDGCPWDAQQTHDSLRVHLLEEAYEVLEAIDRGHTGVELEEELGDLLLQVMFHSQLAADDSRFDIAGVADGIVAKLIRRHPHVFGDVSVEDAAEVIRNWETIKRQEKDAGRDNEPPGHFEGIPSALPALLAAYKTQKRAAALGFDADESHALDRLAGSWPPDGGDLGSALFWLVAVARARGIDPEAALRRAILEFQAGF
ncbi:MAG: MazG family protein [Actinomycetota bacterium]